MSHQFHSWVYTQENWKHVCINTCTQIAQKITCWTNLKPVHQEFGIDHQQPNVETTQMAISWLTYKQNVVHPYNGFGYKKEQDIDTCYNTDSPVLTEQSQTH